MADSGFSEIKAIDGRFLCADTVRFWSMAGVVAIHCTRVFTLDNEGDSLTLDVISTLFKFSTIGFFLASGFLLARNLEGRSSRRVLSKRFGKLFLPWLTWTGIFVVTFGTLNFLRHKDPFLPGTPVPAALFTELSRCLLGSALWFIPNLLVALCALLVFRSYLSSHRLGAVLLTVDLIYATNLYAHWFNTSHTRALFGFVFYLWLGHYAATHLPAFNRLLARFSFRFLLSAGVLAAVIAFAESRLLHQLSPADGDNLNTLRLSNQIYSVLIVLCLAKLRHRTWPRFVDVGRHTFGIYLSHALVFALMLMVFHRLLELHALAAYALKMFFRTGLWALAGILTWSTCFLIARTISATPWLCWMAGLPPAAKRRLVSPAEPPGPSAEMSDREATLHLGRATSA